MKLFIFQLLYNLLKDWQLINKKKSKTYIDFRQYKKALEKKRPANLVNIVEEKKFLESQGISF